ncbi:treslin isoform X3 [Saccopteryx bilineata]|uniref:treslin isoform X3 n=1 Tax=Saccopteryx bilineata TaxID=59482 RepID=UPI00338FD872
MACCHNVMMLLDSAGGAADQSPVRRAALRLLIYLSCRFGLTRVRWAFRFFNSQGARSQPSRVSDFRELGSHSWEDFEEELEARLGDGGPGAHLPGPAPRATHTHSALMETLLDYQWDRPEITSPTKPVLRSSGRRLLDVESEAQEAETALGGFGNAIFLLAPCPHSQRELLQFVSGCEAQAQAQDPLLTPKQVMEKLLPKRVQEVMTARKVTLYWVDTTERSKLRGSSDHVGYWTVCELLHHVGGTVFPLETWSQDCTKAGKTLLGSEQRLSSEPHLSSWILTLPTDSTLNWLLYNSPEYEASFPRMEGTLFLPVEAGKEIQEPWAVILEPLAMHQRHFQRPVRIFLKGTATHWSLPMSGTLGTDSWMLHSPEGNKSTQRTLFQQLVNRLTAEELHLVVSVDPGEGWPPITGVISPLSANATILTVFRMEEAEFQRHLLQTAVAESPQDTASLFPEVVDVVLTQPHSLLEDPATSAPPCPEWAQQELGRTVPWRAAVAERWFLFSNLSGASSHLMESFWLLQAASPNKEELSKTESELTRGLSEFYLRRSWEGCALLNPEDSKKKRGVPPTPVRQKMNTMCRSLKMLNVARLNVKAQKLHPEGSPDAAGEKGPPQPVGGRMGRPGSRGRTGSPRPKDFKTEEELQSYICENYQKTVATGETELYSCARNMISTIKASLKSKGTKDVERNCLQQVKSNLLKTSRSLRQNIGKSLDKEDKVRECQLQVFLRLETCVQCPSVHENADEVDQVVEEVAELLRMVCLTEDSAYLAKFLEGILGLYLSSIPKTLGKLYDSLGFVIPPKLAGVLPTDFFSDDSMTQESKSPLLSVPLASSTQKSVVGGTESEQLEELRTRSAKKRRKNALIRHKSIAEVSQNLRQIEIPKMSKRAAKNENARPTLPQPSLPGKDTGQVTKVRRNLFNQEISSSKRSAKRGLPRSHSVSAVEGLAYQPDSFRGTKGAHRLLTRRVAETPEHKQVSRRLLHRQIQGRSSDPGPEVDVVEESPDKGEISLRRSPRIKQLTFGRTNSGPFYSASQPKSRSVQRVHSFHQNKSDQGGNSPIQNLQSPKRLFFGAVSAMVSPSEKGSARVERPARNTVDSEMPTAYQTPRKSSWKPSSSKATPGWCPGTPPTPLRSPERLWGAPVSRAPAGQAPSLALKHCSPRGCESPSPPKSTPPRGRPLREGRASALGKGPTVLRKPGGQPLASLQSPSSLLSADSSTGSPPGPAITPARCSLRSPLGTASGVGTETASAGRAPSQSCRCPRVLRASQGQEPVQIQTIKAVDTSERPGDTALTSPPIPPNEPFTPPPACDIDERPLWTAPPDSPAPGEGGWQEPRPPPSAPLLGTCAALAPVTASRPASSDTRPRPPLSKVGKMHRKTSDPERNVPQCQPHASAPAGSIADHRVTTAGAGRHLRGADPSLPSPERHQDPGPGFRGGWCVSPPLPVAGDTERLSLLLEVELPGAEDQGSSVSPARTHEGPRTVVGDEKPSLSHLGVPPSPPSSGPGSPQTPSCTLQGATRLSGAPATPPTYEVELEMQASGLPKLRIKKRDASPWAEAESLRREQSVPPGPRGSSSGKSEATYMSPPCLRPLHSSPGKSSGQTYICQSCTPTRCPSSTPSPFQTDTGVPWTPSPKHSGKTTPDTIQDWPRRKRAGGCSLGASVGRGDGSDLAGGMSLLPEGKPGLELGIKTPILGDFELEGVCQLPDQSPPGDSVPKAEEAFSWGQFGLGSRKRLLCVKEEAECEAKHVCEEQSEEASPQLPSTGDDEALISGCTPPPGCALWSCLSASGLQALTQSPLLFQGKTPSSQCRDAAGEDTDAIPAPADSPFSRAFSRRRPISRTYSRKKLIS